MSDAYTEIMALRGMEEFKALARRLKLLGENRRRLKLENVLIPHYLFTEAAGSGVSTHLQLFARMLDEMQLFTFQGEKRVVEQLLLPSIQPMLRAVRAASGMTGAFRGILGVELPDADEGRLRGLSQLMDFAEDRQGDILFVFIAPMKNGEAPAELVKRLSLALPLEVVRFPRLSDEDMCAYARDFVQGRGFSLSAGAEQYLLELMPKLQAIAEFDGLQSLENMVDLLVYRACSTQNLDAPIIDEAALKSLMEQEGYLEQLSVSHGTVRRIGFGGDK